ncbi:BspA family leucine-rich repeat surface protein, partial [Ralstonia pseudosolanacearum]|uniref:BspA family leucine-rich repeat surface protein n=1 Tax=Ralstonia pseudosolanacearum TaxID=1310165 RepID=UPI003D17A130
DVGSVTNMSSMFKYAGYHAGTWSIGDLSGWDVGNVTDMSYMFNYAGSNATAWNIGNLNYISETHRGWDVSKVTNHANFVDWTQSNIDLSKLPWQSD